MREQGEVVDTAKGYATIRVTKKDECSKCGMCLFGKNANYIDINAKNTIGACKGDIVTFEKRESGKFLACLLVFLVPLFLIALSAVLAIYVIQNELWILFLSLITIIIWYSILALIDKKLKKNKTFCSEILSIEQTINKEIKDE